MTATNTELEKASVSWLKAATLRAVKTAVTVAIPFFGAVAAFDAINWLTFGGTVLLAFLLSYATSGITGLPEVTGKTVPVWVALLERALKTFLQSVVAGVGSTLIFQDVNWTVVLQASVIAAIGSFLAGLVTDLPETPIIATGTGRAGDPAVITSVQASPVIAVPVASEPVAPALDMATGTKPAGK